MPTNNARVELGDLLANTIASVVQAQEELDAYAARRQQAFEDAQPGELVLPPLWYTFAAVDVELELAATITHVERSGAASASSRLLARTLDPTSVSLYGHAASAGLKVRVRVAPQGFMPLAAPADEAGHGGDTTEDDVDG